MVYKKKGLSTVEVLVAVFIVMILTRFAFPIYQSAWRDGKISTLKSDLKAYRDTLYIYKLQNGHYPDELKILLDEDYISFNEGINFLGIVLTGDKIDGKGRPIDPFGNRYYYDNETGEIHSKTEDLEDL